MSRRLRRSRAAEQGGGFTLLELLVALVISGLLVTAILQFLHGQGQFVRLQGAREEVQSNARAAVELITSDLRAAPPLAIRMAAADSIRFFSPREWGLLCTEIADVAAPGGSSFSVRIPGAFSPAFKADDPRWGVAVGQTLDVGATAPFSWAFASSVGLGGGGSCAALGGVAGGGAVEERGITATFQVVGAGPTVVPVGAIVFLYEEVKYDIGVEAIVGGRNYIRRMVGYSGSEPDMQPLAGPLPGSGGLEFRYFNRAGSELDPALNTPALLTAAQRSDIASIQVRVRTESSARFGSQGHPQDTSDSTVVRLRN